VATKMYGGFVPALPTPLTPDEMIDEDGVERLIRYVFQKGADGVFVLGSMGEFAKLMDTERERLIRISRELVKNEKHFFVGVSDTGTKRVIGNAERAQKLGADAVVVLPPYFYHLNDQNSVYSFYVDVADAVDVPVIVYSNSWSTKVTISLETFAKLSKHDRIVGVKYSEPELEPFLKLLREVRSERFSVFYGNERLFDKACLAGVDGLVGGVTCLIPDVMREIREAGLKGDEKWAMAGQRKIDRLMDFITDSWIHAVKYALKLLGICDEYVCKPYVPMDPKIRTTVEKVLKELKLI
jgi:dihydrodipicolinate synthase/N-acetylneuraminate lyase